MSRAGLEPATIGLKVRTQPDFWQPVEMGVWEEAARGRIGNCQINGTRYTSLAGVLSVRCAPGASLAKVDKVYRGRPL